ncbi:hypothetical protein ABPG75_005423 [Micractinium tetrahymenae]
MRGSSRGTRRQPRPSHGERKRLEEQRFRTHTAAMLQYCTMYAEQRAAFLRQDLDQRVQLIQERVNAFCRSGGLHPRANEGGAAGDTECSVEVVAARPVLLWTLYGTGVLTIYTLRCKHCGEFEVPPAAVNCHASSPVVPHVWFDGWVQRYSGLFKVRAGVAAHNFVSVLSQAAESVGWQQVQPRQVPPISAKSFGVAMRQANIEDHLSSSPATYGAPIFDSSPVAMCPPCAGYVLQLREAAAAGAAGPGLGWAPAAPSPVPYPRDV